MGKRADGSPAGHPYIGFRLDRELFKWLKRMARDAKTSPGKLVKQWAQREIREAIDRK